MTAESSARPIESGIAIMSAAMLLAPGMDALAKLLGETLSAGEIAFGRFVFQTLVLGAVLALRGRLAVPRGHLGLLALCGLFLAAAILLMVAAVQTLPIANAIAIFFVEPLILTLLSAVFLREPVGWRRVSAVAVGLIGALVVIRPNWAQFGAASVLPLLTAVFFASYLATTRRAGAHLTGMVTQTWAGMFAAVYLGVALLAGSAAGLAPFEATWPDASAWRLLAFLGVVAGVTHVLVATALSRAPASIIAPFQYLEIISATALGWLIWGDFPDTLTWLGTAIILSSGLYIFHRERRLARQTYAGPAP